MGGDKHGRMYLVVQDDRILLFFVTFTPQRLAIYICIGHENKRGQQSG